MKNLWIDTYSCVMVVLLIDLCMKMFLLFEEYIKLFSI